MKMTLISRNHGRISCHHSSTTSLPVVLTDTGVHVSRLTAAFHRSQQATLCAEVHAQTPILRFVVYNILTCWDAVYLLQASIRYGLVPYNLSGADLRIMH